MFAGPLAALDAISADVYRSYEIFLLLVVLWTALLLWRRTTRLPVVEMMGGVVLLAFYELLVTSLGGYVQFWRLHIPFDPLLTLIIWGSALASVPFWKPALDRLTVPWKKLWWTTVALFVVGAAGAIVIAIYKRGVNETLGLAGKALADHPLAVALALLLIGAFTIYAYRRKASGPLSGVLEERKEASKAISNR
jgi:hypothetical protein